jgi:hypothetical protein
MLMSAVVYDSSRRQRRSVRILSYRGQYWGNCGKATDVGAARRIKVGLGLPLLWETLPRTV